MLCPYCGAENAENVVFCASCGFDMTDTAERPDDKAKIPTQQHNSNTGEHTAFEHTRPVRRRKKRKKINYKLPLFAALGIACLVIIISILSSVLDGNRPYRAYEHNIMIEIDGGKVAILQDAKKAKITKLEAEGIADHQASLDGSVVAVLTDQGVLAVIQRTKLTVVAENVSHFVLSVDGTGIGYVAEDKIEKSYALKLYNVKTKKSRDVTYQQSDMTFDLAPDGDSLAYYVQKDGQKTFALVFFDGSKNIPIDDSIVTLMGLSNDGKYIYAVSKDESGDKVLYSYNEHGDHKLLGPCNIRIVYLNEDHTQILYFNSVNTAEESIYETSLSTNGGDSNLILAGSSVATPIVPKDCMNFTNVSIVTVPTDNFYNKVYSCPGKDGSEIWIIREDSQKNELLVSGAFNITLSKKGDYVYYTTDGALKVLKVSHGQQASEKAVLLGEDVVEYVVTSNRKHVYFRTSAGLYCVNGKTGSNKKTVTDDKVIGKLYINCDDVVYYTVSNNVYTSKNGRKGKIVLSDIDSLYGSANGIVYVFMKDDSIRATDGARKPRVVWSE